VKRERCIVERNSIIRLRKQVPSKTNWVGSFEKGKLIAFAERKGLRVTVHKGGRKTEKPYTVEGGPGKPGRAEEGGQREANNANDSRLLGRIEG